MDLVDVGCLRNCCSSRQSNDKSAGDVAKQGNGVRRRGQVAIEILMFTGIFLLAISVVTIFAARETTQRVTEQQAQDAVKLLARTADSVYVLGPGSVEYATVTFPSGFENAGFIGRSVELDINVHGVTNNYYRKSFATLAGTLPQQAGTFNFRVEAMANGTVLIEVA